MSWPVTWQGKAYDIDPLDLDMGEWDAIEQRTGISGVMELMQQIADMKPTAFRALLWAFVRRGEPAIAYSDFGGPTYADVMTWMADFAGMEARLDALTGKGQPNASAGLVPSPTPMDTPPPSSTG